MARARLELGLTREEYLESTAADLAALWDAWEARERRADIRWSRLTFWAAVGHAKPGLRPADFALLPPADDAPDARATPQTRADFNRAFILAFPQGPEQLAEAARDAAQMAADAAAARQKRPQI